MKELNNLGKLLLFLGVCSLFRRVRGFNGYGGYVDNIQEILVLALVLVLLGVLLLFISSNYMTKSNKKRK